MLLVLGAPFLGVKWGFPDDRMLPSSVSARQVGDDLRNDFSVSPLTNVTVVMPDADGVSTADLSGYAAALSKVSGVKDGSAFLTATSTTPLFSDGSAAQLDELHAVATPADRTVQLVGLAQGNHDSVYAITSRLPLVLGIIAGSTLVLLFLLTGEIMTAACEHE